MLKRRTQSWSIVPHIYIKPFNTEMLHHGTVKKVNSSILVFKSHTSIEKKQIRVTNQNWGKHFNFKGKIPKCNKTYVKTDTLVYEGMVNYLKVYGNKHICPFDCPSICLIVRLIVSLSVYLFVCLSVCPDQLPYRCLIHFKMCIIMWYANNTLRRIF